MLVTEQQLAQFSGTHKNEGDTLTAIYIESATDVINAYLGYDCETAERFRTETDVIVVPAIIKLTCLRIATLMQLEENNNIGISGNSFGESGSRTFLNVVKYDSYLAIISQYRETSSTLSV